MSEPIDDILITAYALGELDPAQSDTIAARIAGDPSARLMVEEIRATASILADGLRNEPDVGLTAIHVAAIEQRLAADARSDAPHAMVIPWRRNWGLWGSIAASMLIVVTVMAGVLPHVFRNGFGSGGKQTGGDGNLTSPDGAPSSGGMPVIVPAGPGGSAAKLAGDIDAAPAGAWPKLVTSAGEIAWPAIASPATDVREPTFIASDDFPLAIVPGLPTHPSALTHGTLALLKDSLAQKQLPRPASIRTDDLINAIAYTDAPTGGPIVAKVEAGPCPWNPDHRLVRVLVRMQNRAEAPPSELSGDSGPFIQPLVRDMRVELEMNPSASAGYRVIGYEDPPRTWEAGQNHDLDDVVAEGTTFTLLVEVAPAGASLPAQSTADRPPRKYQKPVATGAEASELMTVTVVYRLGPAAMPARLELSVPGESDDSDSMSADFQTAAGAAALGLALRQQSPAADPSLDLAIALFSDANRTAGENLSRRQLLDLARQVKMMK